jgi:hypothetical protein
MLYLQRLIWSEAKDGWRRKKQARCATPWKRWIYARVQNRLYKKHLRMILGYTTLLSMKPLSSSGNTNTAHLPLVPMGLTATSHTSEGTATPMLVPPVSTVFGTTSKMPGVKSVIVILL